MSMRASPLFHLFPLSLSVLARRAGLSLALGLAATCAHALPVMDMRVEDLLPMAAEFKKSLSLSNNQQILWQQIEAKTRHLIHERQSRRERLQAAGKQWLEGSAVELRDMAGALDAESGASAAEEKQLREWWLGLNDALDEKQRQAVATFLLEQLQRVPDNGGRPAAHGKDDGASHTRGGGARRGGGIGAGLPGS